MPLCAGSIISTLVVVGFGTAAFFSAPVTVGLTVGPFVGATFCSTLTVGCGVLDGSGEGVLVEVLVGAGVGVATTHSNSTLSGSISKLAKCAL